MIFIGLAIRFATLSAAPERGGLQPEKGGDTHEQDWS